MGPIVQCFQDKLRPHDSQMGSLICAVDNLLSGLIISRNTITNTTSSGLIVGGGKSGPGTQNNRVEAITISFQESGRLHCSKSLKEGEEITRYNHSDWADGD